MSRKRQAVSLVLTKNPGSNEVYLVERNPKLKFFGGFWAFPGGTIDDEDRAAKLLNSENVATENHPFIAAAAREIFEETGILLARGAQTPSVQKLAKYQKSLLAEEIKFSEILRKENLQIDANDFNFIASLLTPEFAPVRYDTQFYWVQVPAEQEPKIFKGELIDGRFFQAEQAVQEWQKGELAIVPPVIFMLQELQNSNLKSALSGIRATADKYQAGAIHQIYFAPGVQMIPLKTRTLPPATHTNAYLVGERELYLIDPAAADKTEQEKLWAFLDDRLAEGRKLKGILVTHHHGDHVGALEACRIRYKLPVYAHQKTIERLPGCVFKGSIDDGTELNLGTTPDGRDDWTLTTYFTPGHAPGHLAFFENRYNQLIAGDLIATLSTIVISPGEGHLPTYMDSLKRMANLGVETIYPSHGPANQNGTAVLKHFIKHRQEREDKLKAALSQKPKSISELVAVVYDDTPSALWSLASLSLESGLIKLIEEGKCVQSGSSYCAS